jgi:heptosyltransferase-2
MTQQPPAKSVAVVQPLPGIGDMIWHLQHIRAIAAHVGQPVTLIAKPRSRADQLFSAEQTVRDVLWLDRNPEGRRGAHDGGSGLMRMVHTLRERRFDAVYLLHHSKSIALQLALAGIPRRYGYGYGVQRLLLNCPPHLPAADLRLHPFEQATRWIRAAGMAMDDAEPILPVAAQALDAVRRRMTGMPAAIGIGSSDIVRQWGAQRFAQLVRVLAKRGADNMILVGGGGEAAMADEIRMLAGLPGLPATVDWSIKEIAALLSMSACYIGNDTGFMNMAAAVGIRTFSLSGSLEPIRHTSRIVGIIPPGGIVRTGGMDRITVEQVLSVIDSDPVLRAKSEVTQLAG